MLEKKGMCQVEGIREEREGGIEEGGIEEERVLETEGALEDFICLRTGTSKGNLSVYC